MPPRAPLAEGANDSETVQLVCGARFAAQVFAAKVKSPATTGVCRVAVVPPVLAIVMFWTAEVAPTVVAGKLSDAGVSTTLAAAVAEPARAAVACPPATLPYTVSSPVRVPAALGRNTTCTLQLAPMAIAAEPQLSVSVKSPLVVMEETVSAAEPEFVTVTVIAALAVPACWVANVRLVGESVIAGAAGEMAVSSGTCQMPRP